MRKTSTSIIFSSLLLLSGCSKLFVSYCDRVARGTADQNWILEVTTNTIPFSKASYRNPEGGSPAAICVTAQGPSAELASGKNFAFEIADANDKIIAKKTGSAAAKPINMENKPKLWGGVNQTNKNTHESTECFTVAKLDPYVKVKVKSLRNNETDESKVWNNAAYCKRGKP